MGFNYDLPEWAQQYWREHTEECRRSCFITPNTSESFSVVCERIQMSVFHGTREECESFLGITDKDTDIEDDNSMWDWPGF